MLEINLPLVVLTAVIFLGLIAVLKKGQGLWSASASFTTDLHSLGQMIQEGERNLFETVIFVDHYKKHLYLKEEGENLDGLNYLAGKTLHQVNEKALTTGYCAGTNMPISTACKSTAHEKKSFVFFINALHICTS